jgi:carbohydrate-selective porin OprB
LQWRITPRYTFATWGGVAAAYSSSTNAGAVSTTYLASLGIGDPFNRDKRDLLAIMFGEPLSLIQVGDFVASTGVATRETRSFHIETFYRFTVNDRISVTPGVFVVTNPGNINDNKPIYVGTIRTTFRF